MEPRQIAGCPSRLLPETEEGAGVLSKVNGRPKSIERPEQYAASIGALVKIEPTEQGYRLLVDASADLVLAEMLVEYVEEEVKLGLEEDVIEAPPAWRQLGIIVGYQEIKD